MSSLRSWLRLPRQARAAGAASLVGRYQPTAKNAQVANFYPDHGFTDLGDGAFRFDLSTTLEPPVHIELVTDA